jgi:hypothetical protein
MRRWFLTSFCILIVKKTLTDSGDFTGSRIRISVPAYESSAFNLLPPFYAYQPLKCPAPNGNS